MYYLGFVVIGFMFAIGWGIGKAALKTAAVYIQRARRESRKRKLESLTPRVFYKDFSKKEV